MRRLAQTGYTVEVADKEQRREATVFTSRLVPGATRRGLAGTDCLVCIIRNRVAGAVFLWMTDAPELGAIVYVRALAVREAYRKEGVGSGLLWAVESVSRGARMFGACLPGTEPFYRRNGFSIVDECPLPGVVPMSGSDGRFGWFVS